MTFGFSRDDAGGFLSDYYEKKIFESDPFAHLDQKGVGKLIEMAAAAGRTLDRVLSWASVANMAAIRPASSSATVWD